MNKTYSALFVTATTTGPRYHHLTRGRLFPVARDLADMSIANGATVIRKEAGEHWLSSIERHDKAAT